MCKFTSSSLRPLRPAALFNVSACALRTNVGRYRRSRMTPLPSCCTFSRMRMTDFSSRSVALVTSCGASEIQSTLSIITIIAIITGITANSFEDLYKLGLVPLAEALRNYILAFARVTEFLRSPKFACASHRLMLIRSKFRMVSMVENDPSCSHRSKLTHLEDPLHVSIEFVEKTILAGYTVSWN